jgi:Flp pilus assembly protein TadG
VEFALVVGLFLFLVMGTLDFGRAIYLYNGVSEAARDISRVTSVYPGTPLGTSAQASAAFAAEQTMVGDLASPTFVCVDLSGQTITGTCRPGSRVRVTVSATYSAITPLLDLIAPITVSASSTVTIQ